jgi:hypothetical protein
MSKIAIKLEEGDMHRPIERQLKHICPQGLSKITKDLIQYRVSLGQRLNAGLLDN